MKGYNYDQLSMCFPSLPHLNRHRKMEFYKMGCHYPGKLMNESTLQRRTWSQRLAQTIFKILSWKLDLNYPEAKSFVMIGAPHTSNWDFIYTMLFIGASGIKMNWIGKDSLFRWPFGPLMRWMGGLPVNRRERTDFVSQVVTIFNQYPNLVVAISPEGTRAR